MPEPDFPKPVVAHESALVHVSVDTIEPSFSCVLPHLEIASVLEHGYTLGVLSYHELVAVELAQEVMVVEVGASIDEWFLPVGFLHEQQKLEQRVAEFLRVQSALGFHVYHGQQVLVARTALGHEVLELRFLRYACAIEMIGANLEPVSMGKVYVLSTLVPPSVALR